MSNIKKQKSINTICKSCRSLIITIVYDWQDEDQLILFRNDKDCDNPLIDKDFQQGIVTCFMQLLWYMREKVNEIDEE